MLREREKNQLKQSGEKPQTRVIFCSTLNMPFINDVLQNKAVGIYTRDCLYLLKPIVEDLFCQNQKIKINRVKCTIKNNFHYVLFKIIRYYSWVFSRFTPLFQYFHDISHILKCIICTTAKQKVE